MVDMIVVGNKLGKVGISAVSVGGDVSNFLTFVAIGFSNAGQVLIARYIGSKQHDKIGRFVGSMSSFLLVCAAALIFQDKILALMNTPAESYEGAVSYSAICMAVSFIACTIFLAKNRKQFRLTMQRRDFLHWDRAMLGELVKLCSPLSSVCSRIQSFVSLPMIPPSWKSRAATFRSQSFFSSAARFVPL